MESSRTKSHIVDSSRLRTLLLIGATLLPFGASVVQIFAGSKPTPAVSPNEKPSLAFYQYFVNLGPVRPTPVVGARFRFTNTGVRPVHITDTIPSCGCLKPRLAKTEFQPGETGEIILPVQTPSQTPGPKEYRVTVRYTDPKPREVTLSFHVILPVKQVMVQPRSLIFYQLGFGETKQKIVVTDYPKAGFRILDAKCSSHLATVTLDGSGSDKFGNPQHTATVTVAGTVPPGRHRALITLTTDHKRYKSIRVPIIIQGKKSPNAQTAKKIGPQPARR